MNRTNDNDITALMWAAEEDHGKCVQMLLRAGAHIIKTDKHGRNSLLIQLANARANREIAMLLFAAGRNSFLRLPEDARMVVMDTIH